MAKTATLSTVIDANVKKAINALCKRKGYKLQYLIEQTLIERLEDEIDLEDYHARRNEETVSLEEVLAGLNKN